MDRIWELSCTECNVRILQAKRNVRYLSFFISPLVLVFWVNLKYIQALQPTSHLLLQMGINQTLSKELQVTVHNSICTLATSTKYLHYTFYATAAFKLDS